MWILDNGIWLDLGVWDDTDFWQDYPVAGIILAADGGSYELTGTAAALTIAPAAAGLVLAADAGSYTLTGTAATLQIAPAVVEPPFGGAGIVREPLRPIFGVGYGILPPLKGEAFGFVGAAGVGAAPLPGLKVFGTAAAGAAGHSQARLAIKATASGNRGNAGAAVGQIAGIKAAGIATCDDDEAVAIKVLLDA